MTDIDRHLTTASSETVNDIIAQHPVTVSVFNAFGIDACCGGDATIEEAARRDGADPEALLVALDVLIAAGTDR